MGHVSTCIACTQADDHPKHIVDLDGHNVIWHHDCHVLVADCDICTAQLADAPEGAKGDDLRTHLASLPARQWMQHENGSVTFENVEG